MKYTQEFEEIWQMRPRRAGGDPKPRAFKAFAARLKEKVPYERLRDGMRRYSEYCKGEGLINTPFVMQTATFFSANTEAWEEDWDLPEPEIKETIEQKGARLGIQARPGESMEAYTRRIQQAR